MWDSSNFFAFKPLIWIRDYSKFTVLGHVLVRLHVVPWHRTHFWVRSDKWITCALFWFYLRLLAVVVTHLISLNLLSVDDVANWFFPDCRLLRRSLDTRAFLLATLDVDLGFSRQFSHFDSGSYRLLAQVARVFFQHFRKRILEWYSTLRKIGGLIWPDLLTEKSDFCLRFLIVHFLPVPVLFIKFDLSKSVRKVDGVWTQINFVVLLRVELLHCAEHAGSLFCWGAT